MLIATLSLARTAAWIATAPVAQDRKSFARNGLRLPDPVQAPVFAIQFAIAPYEAQDLEALGRSVDPSTQQSEPS